MCMSGTWAAEGTWAAKGTWAGGTWAAEGTCAAKGAETTHGAWQPTVGSFLTAVVKDSHRGATLSRSWVFMRVKPPT